VNYAAIKDQLRGLINRSDMTDELAATFIKLSQIRLERLLRTSFMQRFVTFECDRADGVFRVPIDYLELIELFTDNGEMERVDMSRYIRIGAISGIPTVFVQTGHDLRMRPYPLTTDTLYFRYYGCEAQLHADEDTNQWSLCAADALIYGAAEYAADHYEDERLSRFADRFATAVAELRDQQQQEDFSGPMSIAPAYTYPD
jgi:hypothetical protein